MSVTTEKVSRIVCVYFGIDVQEMKDISNRKFIASDARAYTWFFLRRKYHMSPVIIAQEFGVSRRSVMLAIHNLDDRISIYKDFAKHYSELSEKLEKTE